MHILQLNWVMLRILNFFSGYAQKRWYEPFKEKALLPRERSFRSSLGTSPARFRWSPCTSLSHSAPAFQRRPRPGVLWPGSAWALRRHRASGFAWMGPL